MSRDDVRRALKLIPKWPEVPSERESELRGAPRPHEFAVTELRVIRRGKVVRTLYPKPGGYRIEGGEHS